MQISLINIGKRFNYDRIFSGVNFQFGENEHSVILGANGSGKSTLLQIIAGSTSASEGKITYMHNGKEIPADDLFRKISFASPAMELLEELTLKEHIAFHARMKSFRKGIHTNDVAEIAGLGHAREKQIRHFSSGMKQRVRLSLAILSDTPLVLLDEPCSNLDYMSVDWYKNLVAENSSERLILVCSNKQEYEYGFCSKVMQLENYKSGT